MKRFSTFLTESSKTWSEADFKHILSNSHHVEAFDAAYAARLREKYVPALIDALNRYPTGDIPNPVFVQIKDTANRFVEVALKKPEFIWALIRGQRNEASEMSWDFDASSTHVIAGKLKKALALRTKTTSTEGKAFLDWIIPILTELAPVAVAIEGMKARAVKRAPAATDAEKSATKASYIKAFASSETTQLIWEALKEMTDTLKVKYADSIDKLLQSQAQRWASYTDEERKVVMKDGRGRFPDIATKGIWEHTGRYGYTLKSDWKATLRKDAERTAKHMQEEFLFKNVAKLKSIVEAKGVNLLAKPRSFNLSASGGTFSGDMELKFTDGSRFDVRNKVVVKQNSYGTVFNQYPTTFHNVVMPDGKPMGAPSEERMNTIFVKGKQ